VIKLIVFDVDGCLTDGGIIYGGSDEEYKVFNVKDGFVIVSLAKLGYKSAIITGRASKVVERRSKELKIDYLYQGVKDKKATLDEILKKEKLTLENVAAIGDDINDLKLLKSIAWSFAPNDAMDLVKQNVTSVLKLGGGKGAVREMIDLIFEKEGKKEEFLKLWL
jgi:3-deoxy-D-manno-octulosonate 8-phosphate phosphatase (KDO 8-P phosphatase)